MTSNTDGSFVIPEPQAKAAPIADFTYSLNEDQGGVVSQKFAVRVPEEDANDFVIPVRASALRKCRAQLEEIRAAHLPWSELILAGASLMIGASLGAVPSNISSSDPLYKLYFFAFPPIGVAMLAAFIHVRKLGSIRAAFNAESILERLPNPEKTIGAENESGQPK